jgi:phospholipid/cholesterol/gamma-HCH transport system ATP-binding protein
LYLSQGLKEWEGNKDELIYSNHEKLNEFIFASQFLKDAKNMRKLEDKGEITEQGELKKTI